MKRNETITAAILFGISTIFGVEAKIGVKKSSLFDPGVKKSSINLTVESTSDVYGVQFDIKYNPKEVSLTENDIKSKIEGINIYSRVKDEGTARVLMFGLNGEKVLDVNSGNISEILDINFQSVDMFNGNSLIELIDVTLAGKGGEEVSSTTSTFQVSFTPIKTSLSKNYPNPFNPSTTINYELSDAGMVSLVVFDLKGAEVKTLVQQYQEPNYYNITWNGLNNNGQSVASGRYILKMTAPGYNETITMTLLK